MPSYDQPKPQALTDQPSDRPTATACLLACVFFPTKILDWLLHSVVSPSFSSSSSLSTANLSALFLCHSGRSMWKKGIGRGRGRYIGLWRNGWVPWVVFSLSKGGRREATAGHRSVRARLESTPGHSWSSAIGNDNFSETAVTVFITRHSEYNDYAQCLVCDVVLEVVVRQNTRGTGRKTFRIKEKVALYTEGPSASLHYHFPFFLWEQKMSIRASGRRRRGRNARGDFARKKKIM